MSPLFARLYQTAYVTNDLERALGVFRDRYGIPSFFTIESRFEAVVAGAPARMALRIALANVGDLQVEVIQDLGSSVDLYTAPLPADGSFRTAFHHVCVLIRGGIESWERHLAELGDRPHYYVPQTSEGTRAIYTDERAQLGHFVEHVWYAPENWERMNQIIPRHGVTSGADRRPS